MPSPSSLPSAVRAALGLAATMVDEARHLPDKAIEMPMRAISQALQLSLRAQQRYAALAARGDEIISGRRTTDEAPSWATFDDPIEAPQVVVAPAAERANRRPKPRPAKTVRAPRNGKASAFDAVEEPAPDSDAS
ncbi:MAG: hypothetical protein ACRDVG_15615 [Jatrophihabitantaceae bacterium]